MQIELIEIRDHLNRFAPFDNLPEQILDAIARQVQVGYFKAGSEILAVGAPIHELHYVRSGAVEIHRRGGSCTTASARATSSVRPACCAATRCAWAPPRWKSA